MTTTNAQEQPHAHDQMDKVCKVGNLFWHQRQGKVENSPRQHNQQRSEKHHYAHHFLTRVNFAHGRHFDFMQENHFLRIAAANLHPINILFRPVKSFPPEGNHSSGTQKEEQGAGNHEYPGAHNMNLHGKMHARFTKRAKEQNNTSKASRQES